MAQRPEHFFRSRAAGPQNELSSESLPPMREVENNLERQQAHDEDFIARNRNRRNSADLPGLSFPVRLAAVGRRHLFSCERDEDNVPTEYNLSLSTLQRMVIHDLQSQLCQASSPVTRDKKATAENMEFARDILAKYTEAIRDYDFMMERLDRSDRHGEPDLFTITSRDRLGLALLKDSGLVSRSSRLDVPGDEYSAGKNILPGQSRHYYNDQVSLARLFERFWMGIFGGMALIAPMLLMVLHPDLLTSLLTTSVATLLFAAIVAYFGVDLTGQDVLGLVAAYAAVLVVFIGTSSGTS